MLDIRIYMRTVYVRFDKGCSVRDSSRLLAFVCLVCDLYSGLPDFYCYRLRIGMVARQEGSAFSKNLGTRC